MGRLPDVDLLRQQGPLPQRQVLCLPPGRRRLGSSSCIASPFGLLASAPVLAAFASLFSLSPGTNNHDRIAIGLARGEDPSLDEAVEELDMEMLLPLPYQTFCFLFARKQPSFSQLSLS